jgi:hypothetical protein
MRTYTDLPVLSTVVLEASWVLGIRADPGRVQFSMEFVLAADDPDYTNPEPGKQHCTRRGTMTFVGVTNLHWSGQGMPPALDAANEVDFGNVDSFEWDDSNFELEGSFGRMAIAAREVVVERPADRPAT